MKSSFVTHDDYDINRMDCLKPYQPYGLLQAIQHPLKHWYAHKHNGLAFKFKVCTTWQAQVALSHCLDFTYLIHYARRKAHTGEETFKNDVVVDRLALK